DLLRDLLGDLFVVPVELDEHPDGRRQVPVGPVQVGGHVAALKHGVAAELELLLDRGAGVLDQLLDGLAVLRDGPEQGQPVGRPVRQRRLRDLGRQLLEALVLRHEVGLAVQLDQNARGRAIELGDHQAVGGGPVGPLARVLDALLAQDLDGLVEVAVGLAQGVLAVHHAGPGQVPEPLDVSGGKIRHCLFLAMECLSAACQRHSALSAAASGAAVSVAAASVAASAAGVSVAASAAGVSVAAASGAASAISASASASVVTGDSWISSAGAAAGAAALPASRSRSHSGSGSSLVAVNWSSDGFWSVSDAPAREMRPSATASATTRVSSATERIASSLPGIG